MNDNVEIVKLYKGAYELRKNLIKLSASKTIHIGGDLSCADILTVLWQHVMKYVPTDPSFEGRDRFILSKGHCAAAVSLCQAAIGCFTVQEVLNEYGTEECRFNMAPCKHKNQFFECSATGSLGQGLSIGTGMAVALKMKKNLNSKVFVMTGDGEMQEGSNWEAIMYGGQKQLNNLVLIVDNNKLQFDGLTSEIVSMNSLSEKLRLFGWKVYDVNGHDIRALVDVFDNMDTRNGPVVINAHTIKGKGVSYMEGNYIWHAGKLNGIQLESALEELDDRYHKGVWEDVREI